MTGAVLFLLFMAVVVGGGIWLGKRLAREMAAIDCRISTMFADIDMDRLDAAMNEHLGELHDES